MSKLNTIITEIKDMLYELNLECYNDQVIEHIKSATEKLCMKLLKNVVYYKETEKDINKSGILLAIDLETQQDSYCMRPDVESLEYLANEINAQQICIKDSCGLRIPKENLGSINYQLENPNKKAKQDYANNIDCTNKLNNCFTFLMNSKRFKPPNMGGFVLKNSQTMQEIPMKITIRPKINLQQNMSMLKK